MPSFTRSKYTPAHNQELAVAAMVVLADSKEALTCDQIKQGDLILAEVTPQKMARVLNELVEAGFVVKTKGRSGRMVYKSVGVLLDQGYDLNQMVF